MNRNVLVKGFQTGTLQNAARNQTHVLIGNFIKTTLKQIGIWNVYIVINDCSKFRQ